MLGTLLLALAWAALQGEFSLNVLITGYLIGFAVVYALSRGGVLSTRFHSKVGGAIGLAAFFLWQIILANLRVALDVINPEKAITPAVVAVPLDAETDEEILILSALINITPGSVTLDLSDDRRTLYVHVMHVHTIEESRREIKDGFERRLLQVLR